MCAVYLKLVNKSLYHIQALFSSFFAIFFAVLRRRGTNKTEQPRTYADSMSNTVMPPFARLNINHFYVLPVFLYSLGAQPANLLNCLLKFERFLNPHSKAVSATVLSVPKRISHAFFILS